MVKQVKFDPPCQEKYISSLESMVYDCMPQMRARNRETSLRNT